MSNILLIDDELLILELTRTTLTAYGFRVDVALTGTEAIRMVKSMPDKYPIIILDLMLPDLNGYEVLIELQDIFKNKNTAIIVHTATTSEHKIEKIKRLSMVQSILIKPYHYIELLEAVNVIRSGVGKSEIRS